MKAIVVESASPLGELSLQEVSSSDVSPTEVRIRVRAAGVNRADLLQKEGKYPPPPGASEVLGLEVAGEIVECGSSVEEWIIGDRVAVLLAGGGYATEAIAPASMLLPLDPGWDFTFGASLPEAFYTAYLSLFIEGAMQPGETVLIHGGASGVGTAAIQLARQFHCLVIATAGTEEKCARCKELGAHHAINYREADFLEYCTRHVPSGVDLVLDMVGGPYLERHTRLLKKCGRLVVIATMGGPLGQLHLPSLLTKRLRIVGTVLRSRSLDEKIELTAKIHERVWPLLRNGTVRPVIDSVFKYSDAETAHRRMSENQNVGKIILVPDEDPYWSSLSETR